MADMSFTWTITGVGWADCTIADDQSKGRAHVSYISTAPESFLDGVTRIVLGARHIKAELRHLTAKGGVVGGDTPAKERSIVWVFPDPQSAVQRSAGENQFPAVDAVRWCSEQLNDLIHQLAHRPRPRHRGMVTLEG